MPISVKYGTVTLEYGAIGDDEPVIVLLASDKLAPRLLDYYLTMCSFQDCGKWQQELVERQRAAIVAWQRAHPEMVGIPTSEDAKAWLAQTEDSPAAVEAAAELEPLPDGGAISETSEAPVSLGAGTA